MSALTAAVKASPLWIAQNFPFEVSGLMPAVARRDGTNVLSLYLLHVSRDPYWRNAPVQGVRAQLNSAQPLSLNLSYLLTSYAEKSWQMEQYLMSVALSYFHANPIHIGTSVEYTVTVEADSIEEMSRLWQAITVPIRLSAMFRVAVIFLTPADSPQPDMPTPVEANISVGADLNLPAPVPPVNPQLFEMAVQLRYRVPPGSTDILQVVSLPGLPVAVGGETVRARGSGLTGVNASAVFLSVGGSEWPITSWRVLETSASGTAGDADELVLALPATYAATPAAGSALTDTPLPGNYLLTVGNPGTSFRSNALPVAIAPIMTGLGPLPPVLIPDPLTSVYTMDVSGLVTGETAVLLDTTLLAIGAAPAPGVVVVDPVAGTASWMLPSPSPFASKSYVQVRVQVNGIEAPPAWWVQTP
jgi:hypothetical protein